MTVLKSESSNLRIYSQGIVVEDKESNSDYIKVIPIEHLPMVKGSIKDSKEEYKTNTKNSRSVNKTGKLVAEKYLVAKWIRMGDSNRVTAPNVKANETVTLYRFADTDEFYWTDQGREPSLRRKETVCNAYSNIDSGTDAFDKSTSYYTEVSTEDKHIEIHTSKNDGEPFAYDIKLDTKSGVLDVRDDGGNSFQLDSKSGVFTIVGVKQIIMDSDVLIKRTLTVEGAASLGSGSTTTGSVTINGNVSVNGSQTTSGDNITGGSNSNHHGH